MGAQRAQEGGGLGRQRKERRGGAAGVWVGGRKSWGVSRARQAGGPVRKIGKVGGDRGFSGL